MDQRRLGLRSLPTILAAYIAAPVVALGSYWALSVVLIGVDNLSPEQAAQLLFLMFLYGGPFGLVIEVLTATPLLFGFQRYRWRWLTGYSAALIGFFAASLPFGVLVAWPLGATED